MATGKLHLAENHRAATMQFVRPHLHVDEVILAMLPSSQAGPLIPFEGVPSVLNSAAAAKLLSKSVALVVTNQRILVIRRSRTTGHPESFDAQVPRQSVRLAGFRPPSRLMMRIGQLVLDRVEGRQTFSFHSMHKSDADGVVMVLTQPPAPGQPAQLA